MSGFLTIKLEKRLSEQLARAKREAVNLTTAMDRISELMLENVNRRFANEVGVSGVPWKRSRRAIEDGGKTLRDKGFLQRSIDRRSGPDFAEVGVEGGGPQVTYAAIHQFGGTITPKNKKALSFGGRLVSKVVMPARPYLGFDPEEREDIEAILSRHLRSAFEETAA